MTIEPHTTKMTRLLVFLLLFFSPAVLGHESARKSTTGWAEVNGTKLYYEVAGNGPTIVLIHGGLVDSRMWDDQMKEFSKRHRVVRYDLRGFGKSAPATESFSHVEDLNALLDYLKIERTVIVGLSLGGMIAMDFTLEHPEKVERLVLAGSGLRGDKQPPDKQTVEAYRAAKQGADAFVEAFMKTALFASVRPNTQAHERLRRMLFDNFKALGMLRPGFIKYPEPPTIERLGSINVPTLVVIGGEDAQSLKNIADILLGKIHGARKVVISGASHHLPVERPKEFSKIVLDFIDHRAGATRYQRLKRLFSDRQYFDLREAVSEYRGSDSAELIFYRGAVANKFNQPLLSISYLRRFLRDDKSRVDPDLTIEAYELLADDYRKTYQYRKAAQTYRLLLERFGSAVAEKKRANYENEFRLWNALQNAPPQTATFKGNSLIQKDREGHIPFKINGQKMALTFDTGANLSVIIDSLARKLRLKLIDSTVDVGSVSGIKVKAKLAIVEKIEIGNVTIRNAVFLVFQDKDFYIPQANLQINGVVGFPVISALREMTVRRDGKVQIPRRQKVSGERNLCLDGFAPMIAGWFEGRRLAFAFDTGANSSVLYQPFFKTFQNEITSRYQPHTERVQGVGGYREIKAYLANDLVITFSGKQARYAKIPILTEQTTESSQYLFGNIGTDLMNQFEKMTINFVAMSIVFE